MIFDVDSVDVENDEMHICIRKLSPVHDAEQEYHVSPKEIQVLPKWDVRVLDLMRVVHVQFDDVGISEFGSDFDFEVNSADTELDDEYVSDTEFDQIFGADNEKYCKWNEHEEFSALLHSCNTDRISDIAMNLVDFIADACSSEKSAVLTTP